MSSPEAWRSTNHWQAALVDLDGTLVDTLDDFARALGAMLSEFDRPPLDRKVIEAMIGKGSENLIRSVLARVALDSSLFDAAYASYQRHYLAVNGAHAPLYPGVLEGLEWMRSRGWKLACVTNKPTLFARPLLAAKGLDGFFDALFGGDAFARKKPDPMPLLQACKALGVEPARTLMIGDSVNDVTAARGAGCPVVLVGYGYNHGEPPTSAGADGVLASLADLQLWLEPTVNR